MAYKYDPILRMNVNDENHYDSIKIKRSKASEVLRTARSHGFQKGDVWIEGDTCCYLRGSEGEAFKEDLHHGDLTRDERTTDKEKEQKAWTVEYELNGIRVTRSIGVVAESENEAIKKAKKYLSKMGWAHILGARRESLEIMKRIGRTIIDEKTWDNAIQAADASRIIEQKNGYTLGINSQGTICLAFPGETIDNPHMYLGKENEKNLADAKAMFKQFSSLRG